MSAYQYTRQVYISSISRNIRQIARHNPELPAQPHVSTSASAPRNHKPYIEYGLKANINPRTSLSTYSDNSTSTAGDSKGNQT